VFKFITTKPLWVNILAAIILILLLLSLFFFSLSWLTNHGQNEKVPAVIGQNYVAAEKILKAKNFDVAVLDSVFIDSVPKGSVIKQSPEAEAMVKGGRTVYLTINRTVAPLIEMPSLVGFSFRSAEMYLKTLGLKLGDTTSKPDIARNSILQQLYNGADIKPGTKISMGSTISFVIGSGLGAGDTDVPDLFGMTLKQAHDYLNALNISIGSVIPQGAVADSNKVFIEKQEPSVYTTAVPPATPVRNRIRPGQVMYLYITTNLPVRDTATQTP
jgi:eukaryotic-like serine/threonine-protein kinase